MTDGDATLVWLPQSPWAWAALLLLTMALMYLGRSVAHAAIRAFGDLIRSVLRASCAGLISAQESLLRRNREVLLEMGRESMERLLEREFHRVNEVVSRDLSGYPAIHRQLADQIARIDEDYRASTEVPPEPPQWTRAVEAVSSIPSTGDPVVSRILADIRRTLAGAHQGAMREYRRASSKRHSLLGRMLPFWRKLNQTLEHVHGTIAGLQERSRVIDRHMDRYGEILAKTDRAARTLSASATTHFVSSALVLLIVLLGGFVNFHLIALPMSEMVGATSYVGSIRTSDIAALVVILMEVAMGLFLMESLHITRLFPVIGTMDDRMRRRMVWTSLGILLVLAGVEASLAYMRDLLAADREALTQSLAGVEVHTQLRWIPSIGQMVMGFILPFALSFAAIPLESFIQSSRIVGGSLIALVLRGAAALLELAAGFVGKISGMMIHLYDFAIVLPLRLEQELTQRQAKRRRPLIERPNPGEQRHELA